MPLNVSVALCTHNGVRYIEEQLRSILDQTVLPSEVVISDDASSDGTLNRVDLAWKRWAKDATSPVLRILHNETPLGVTKNFEQALTACTSDLVALSDQDDRWHENRLERAIRRFETSPKLLLLHADATLVNEAMMPLGASLSESLEISEKERTELTRGDGFRALLRRNLVTGATTMIRRELLDISVPFPEPWVHDEWLAMIAAATGHIDYLTDMLIDYRQHDNNQIGVRKLTLRGKVGRVLEPRLDRNDYLLARARVLLDRIEELGGRVPASSLEITRNKVAHQAVRAALSNRRFGRLRLVLREAATGRYSQFSRGPADILRDLLQPSG